MTKYLRLTFLLSACGLFCLPASYAQSVSETPYQRAPGVEVPNTVRTRGGFESGSARFINGGMSVQAMSLVSTDTATLAAGVYADERCAPSAYFDPTEFQTPVGEGDTVAYNYGYQNGTSAPLPVEFFATRPENPFIVADHALSFTTPASFTSEYRVSEVIIPWAPGTQQVGKADELAVTLYGAWSQDLTHIYTQSFRLSDFEGLPDKIRPGDPAPFDEAAPYEGKRSIFDVPWYRIAFDEQGRRDNPLPSGRQVFVSLETRRLIDPENSVWSDDTVCVYLQPNRALCNPDNVSNWWFSFKDSKTGEMVAFLERNLWWEGKDEIVEADSTSNYFSQPWIIPIIGRYAWICNSTQEPLGTLSGLTLYSAYPNPAVDFTNIRYDLQRPGKVGVVVRDAAGKTVYRSANEFKGPGKHVFELDTRAFSCGVYTYVVVTDGGAMGGKFLVEQ